MKTTTENAPNKIRHLHRGTLETQGNHQNVGWGNWFPRAPLYGFLTRTVTIPQAQLGWEINSKVIPYNQSIDPGDCLNVHTRKHIEKGRLMQTHTPSQQARPMNELLNVELEMVMSVDDEVRRSLPPP